MTQADRGQVAATAAEIYDSFFLPALFEQWVEPTLDAINLSAADHLVDVGCGTGVVARNAAARIGNGKVVGIDPNEGMLAVARKSSNRVEWIRGAAENLPVDSGMFDVAVCQFAMMFFQDRAKSVAEIRRVLRPGGRAVVATWASLDATPGYAAMVALLDRLFGRESGDALRAPYNMGDPALLTELLSREFGDVRVRQVDGTARFSSITDWVHTDIRGWTLSDMSDSSYERLLESAQTDLRRFTDHDGAVAFPAPALIGSGVAQR